MGIIREVCGRVCLPVMLIPIFYYCLVLHISSHEDRDGASPSLEVLNVSYIEKKMTFGSVTGTCEPLKTK